MINYFVAISLETWSHVAGVMGLTVTLIFAFLAWRKGLIKMEFGKFHELYTTQMSDFKTEVRGYINKADASHTKTLDHIAELYVKTHNEIVDQNRICGIVQAQKPIITKTEKAWKARIEKEILSMDKKLIEIEIELRSQRK